VAPPVQSNRAGTWVWFVIAAAVGGAVEIALSVTARRREAWDSEYYWIFGVPAMILAAFICGLFARRGPVRIGYAPFLGQLITMVVRTGGGSLLPLGIILKASSDSAECWPRLWVPLLESVYWATRAPGIPPASGSTGNSA